jgi:type VI secretion system secreted protein VgrG
MPDFRRSIHDLIYGRQYNRILRLSFPNNDPPSVQFVVDKIDAKESLSNDFDFTVELLCDDASVALKEMQGKLLNIELVRKDGSLRYFSGYVFSFRRRHSDGGITFYEAKLGPWLKFLSLRKDNYLFHNKTLREQTESIFRDYGSYPQWEWRVTGEDPAMTDACQFNETDFNYVSRRWETAGWYYWYEHDAAGHKLIVSSDSTLAPPIDGGIEVRFHGEGGALEEDAIDRWSPERKLMPSSFALNSFSFKDPRPSSITLPTLNQQGIVPEIESYEYAGAYGFRNSQDGDAQCRTRLEEIEANARHIDAQGNNRSAMSGRWFRLTDHFSHRSYRKHRESGKDEFLIVAAHHIAMNNYLQTKDEKTLYRNWLTCTRRDIPWRPGRHFNSTDTRILAPQTAIVVGPSAPDSIHTDEYGRVRVQFHWDRESGNNECGSAWIRVTSSWAGSELGAAAIPRIGSEVVVQWLDGCPDRPIITGAVFNQCNMAPWILPAQQALTGFRSRELPEMRNSSARRSNHLIFDDTGGQIQAQLKSDHQHSQLSLGYFTRIQDNRGRLDARGEGWELRTDGHGVARAAGGMIITTEKRANAESHAKDIDETIQRLEAAYDLHKSFSSQALQCGAQENGQQDQVANALEKQNEAIAGSGDKFSELSEPHLVLTSSTGIETSSAQSTHISSGHHTAITTGQSLSMVVGDSLFTSIKNTFSLFVHKIGMKFIAAGGNITIHAQKEDVEVIAGKVISLISQTDWIELKGKKGIRLHGADSMLEISDVVQFFTSKPVLFHGNLETLKSSGRPHPNYMRRANDMPPRSARGKFDERFHLVAEDETTPLAHRRYRIVAEDGQSWEGTTNAEGLTERIYTSSEQKLSIEIINS